MKVTVIIPAINEAASIQLAVNSAWQAGADEVVVADGGSKDDTISIAVRLGCQVVTSGAGRAIQQNAGARRAVGEMLVFLHADNHLAPDALAQIRQACRDTAVKHGAFKQRIKASGICYRLLEWGNAWRVRWCGTPYGDQTIFVRRELFCELGGFPEVRLMEDVMLAKRTRKESWPLLLDGPVYIDARRWQRHGVIRQTLRNWMLLTAFRLGYSTESLARFYRRHDGGIEADSIRQIDERGDA